MVVNLKTKKYFFCDKKVISNHKFHWEKLFHTFQAHVIRIIMQKKKHCGKLLQGNNMDKICIILAPYAQKNLVWCIPVNL